MTRYLKKLTCVCTVVALSVSFSVLAAEGEEPQSISYPVYPPAPVKQDQADADRKSEGCISCHTASDAVTMHVSQAVVLGCTDCHGGAADVFVDSDGDGNMDDLDGDGAVTRDDAAWLARFIDDMERAGRFGELVGGVGTYGSDAAHGPFVHVDARGYRARW